MKMPGLGSIFLRPGRKMHPKPNFFKPKNLPVHQASAKPVLQTRARLQQRRPLSREEQIRAAGARAQRNAIIRRINVPFERRLARVGADVKRGKLSFKDGALIIEGINAQREMALRRLGLK